MTRFSHSLPLLIAAAFAGPLSLPLHAQVAGAVTLMDLMLAYDRGPWRLAFNINNLADKTYIATCLNRGDCWFGTRRRAVLSASYKF